ncbi:uncharacterized protein LOC133203388 [Saccostrea echinata]|uniref:uncharacterized protein LOC133203388 n=1 Tax=Saccostrea echinata TaxID=191078 RepID=UPI002A7EB745|nr:uncharacterized protein LOC133203388 [Saccostrea echinata]
MTLLKGRQLVQDSVDLQQQSRSTPIPLNGAITKSEGETLLTLLQDVVLLKQGLASTMNQVTFLQSELREQRKLHKSEIENLRGQMETLQQFTNLCNRTIHEGIQEAGKNMSSLVESVRHLNRSMELDLNIDRKTNDSRSREITTNTVLSRMQTKIQHLETDVNTRISFTAGRTATKQDWTVGERIVFTAVIDSQGGGYNASTGIFTVPKNGTYLFFCNILTYANHNFNADIVVNGHTKERIQVHSVMGRTHLVNFLSICTTLSVGATTLKKEKEMSAYFVQLGQ